MLQDFSSATLAEARPGVVATERLTLRRPILADVRTIARLANDRRVAENTRRLPHPYSQDPSTTPSPSFAPPPRSAARPCS
ncbi:RimJ/RimL family protein N-acetyltransferase [Bradyrhizobium ottawaense]